VKNGSWLGGPPEEPAAHTPKSVMLEQPKAFAGDVMPRSTGR
jgi:hypothetical protein